MIHYEKKQLRNGLTVIAEQDISTNTAVVNILYKVGSKNDLPEKTGFAHLFEHLMFGGSLNVPEFDTPLQSAGGENNAFTNNDFTNYYDVIPDVNLEVALWAEADRMLNLELDERKLNIQKKVVIEEFKEVCLNKPYGDSWHHLSDLSFEQHPYRWPTIGLNTHHIENINLSDVSSFYHRYYTPENAILSIVSPRPCEEVFQLADKWFGGIPLRHCKNIAIDPEPPQYHKRYKKVFAKVPVPLFMMAFHMPGRTSDDYYVCDLISDMLANGKSSRLYQHLVKKKRLMSNVDCYITGSNDPGLIVIEGRPMKGKSIQACVDAIWAIIEEIKAGQFTSRALQKAKNKVISSLAMSDLSPLNRAISMAYFDALNLIEKMNHQESIYESIWKADIVKAANQYLVLSNMNQLDYLPSDYQENPVQE